MQEIHLKSTSAFVGIVNASVVSWLYLIKVTTDVSRKVKDCFCTIMLIYVTICR